MKLKEISINITTRYLEQERNEFINVINSVINNGILLTPDEFMRLLALSSEIMKKYKVDDPLFKEIFDAFSNLVDYYKRGK